MRILIIGNGYLGNRCLENWPDAIMADKHINTVEDVLELLDKHKPDAVLNAAGVVGKPNVDWCETHQMETIKGNTILPIIIAEACQQKNVYLLHIGTGCIFYGKSPSGEPWKENDPANPAVIYTRSKYATDLVLSTLPNVGIARIRIPIDDHSTPVNLIDKLKSFTKIVDVENSLTVVPDMIDAFRQLLEKKGSGIFHTVNPGSIKHREIVALIQKYIDPNFKPEFISETELVDSGLVKKKRSNNIMQSENLEKLGIHMRPVKEAVEACIKKFGQQFNNLII